jgi:hypothetical protein
MGMRMTKTALAFSLVAGMVLIAQSARAGSGVISDLAEGFWAMENQNDPNNNICETGSDGGFFETFGSIFGSAQKTAVRVDYDTPQPTSVSRNKTTIKTNQNKFSTLNVLFNGTTVSGGPQIVEKCTVNGSVNTTAGKEKGNVSVNCSGSDVTQVLSADNATLVQSAFSDSPNIKFKVNVNNGHWSLSIKCKGDASLD